MVKNLCEFPFLFFFLIHVIGKFGKKIKSNKYYRLILWSIKNPEVTLFASLRVISMSKFQFQWFRLGHIVSDENFLGSDKRAYVNVQLRSFVSNLHNTGRS